MSVEKGMMAPDFTLGDQNGSVTCLGDHRGSLVVLYFYPKDDTRGCTQEACDFRDQFDLLSQLGVIILGVSRDSALSHKRFCDKHSLPFRLLVDEETQVSQAYGVWVERSMYGRRYMGIQRSTFLIDIDGSIKAAWHKVKVSGHVDEVVAAVKSLGRSGE